jgi:hypothetical protein
VQKILSGDDCVVVEKVLKLFLSSVIRKCSLKKQLLSGEREEEMNKQEDVRQ